MSRRGNLSRRGFMQRSLAAMTAAGLPNWFAREQLAIADEKAGDKDNDPIRIGVIGIGSGGKGSKRSHMTSRARQLINDIRNTKRRVQFTAACDVDAVHLQEGADALRAMGHSPKSFKDFRELNDCKDVDVVLVATPDQWHALCAIDAMKKGKDVYCEKPLTLTVAEAQAILKVQKATNRVFQTGSQQRSDGRFRLACELVRNGRIGKIHRVECRIGGNPVGTFKPSPVPEGLDWDLWLGPCPKVDYVTERCHYQYRWWYEYSGGKMTDWGAHHLDIAQWGLGMDGNGPAAIEATGDAPATAPHSYNCHPRFRVTYTYADGAVVIASDGTLKDTVGDRDGNGILFVGEKNQWIFVNRGKISASDPKLLSEPLASNATKLEVSPGHMRNFFDCLKSRKLPICNASVGASSVTICHIGVIALRTGKKLKWDAAMQQFDDADANAMLSRPYRAPWKLEV